MSKLTRDQILNLQKALNVNQTGEMDNITMGAIHNYQMKHYKGMMPTSWNTMYEDIVKSNDVISDTESDTINSAVDTESLLDADLDNSSHLNSKLYTEYMLHESSYVTDFGKIGNKRDYIFLHHTAGWNNPFAVVDQWNSDNRGRIGTEYIIGGINIRDLSQQYDGKIVKCIPDGYFAWHLGIGNTKMHRESIGIELCNFGFLHNRNGEFYTDYGQLVLKGDVIELTKPFRGHKFYHAYTHEQINALYFLLKKLHDKHEIDITQGLPKMLKDGIDPHEAFEFNQDARNGNIKGILSHTNVIKTGKFDVYPHPMLIDMLKSL